MQTWDMLLTLGDVHYHNIRFEIDDLREKMIEILEKSSGCVAENWSDEVRDLLAWFLRGGEDMPMVVPLAPVALVARVVEADWGGEEEEVQEGAELGRKRQRRGNNGSGEGGLGNGGAANEEGGGGGGVDEGFGCRRESSSAEVGGGGRGEACQREG